MTFARYCLCLLAFCLFVNASLAASGAQPSRECDLVQDLALLQQVDCCRCERFPVYYNHALISGYFVTPAARMMPSGVAATQYSYHPPYSNYSVNLQVLDRLELGMNYRIFIGMEDPILSPYGFGDFSDKGANWKIAIALPEDNDYRLPGLAIGMEDFHGTRGFKSTYIVATQVLLDLDAEVSVGWGDDRLKGFFGGVHYLPFRRCGYELLENFAVVAEYDPIDYLDPSIEKHPDGRSKSSDLNVGLKWRLWDNLDLSMAYIRGEEVAASATLWYNVGCFDGCLPKVDDPLRYRAPINVHPRSHVRPESVMIQDLVFAFDEQGFDIMHALVDEDCTGSHLYLYIENCSYRFEDCVRLRLYSLLAHLVPSDFDRVTVILQTGGLPVQAYQFRNECLKRFRLKQIPECELALLSPITEVCHPSSCAREIFYRARDRFCWSVYPRWRTFFGSANGKLKYSIGIGSSVSGTLLDSLDYYCRVGYDVASSLGEVGDRDRLNPSQIINVRSDAVNYFKGDDPYVEALYLEKTLPLARGLYGRTAGGYFESMYGGAAAELLYYPVCSDWAIGVEGAYLGKRQYTGLAFMDKIRKLDGFTPTYQDFTPWQAFANLYYDCKMMDMDLRLSAGHYLAGDLGFTVEVGRYFHNGLRFAAWYTYTDGGDKLNGSTYHDKGLSVTLPLDFFFCCSKRNYWTYGMSAWLRDVGQRAFTGRPLYARINAERR